MIFLNGGEDEAQASVSSPTWCLIPFLISATAESFLNWACVTFAFQS